jgi:hypothetical protein
MAAVATHATAPSAHVEEPRTDGPAQRLFEPRGVTLEGVVLGAWEDLAEGRRAECPVCGGSMSMLAGCDDCGSELS